MNEGVRDFFAGLLRSIKSGLGDKTRQEKFIDLARKHMTRYNQLLDRYETNNALPQNVEDEIVKCIDLVKLYEMAAGQLAYDEMYAYKMLQKYGDTIRRDTKNSGIVSEADISNARFVLYLNDQPAAYYSTKQEAERQLAELKKMPKHANLKAKIVKTQVKRLREEQEQVKQDYQIKHGDRAICSFPDKDQADEYCQELRKKMKDKNYHVVAVPARTQRFGVV